MGRAASAGGVISTRAAPARNSAYADPASREIAQTSRVKWVATRSEYLVQRDVDAREQIGVDGAGFVADGGGAVVHQGVPLVRVDQPHFGCTVCQVCQNLFIETDGPFGMGHHFEGDQGRTNVEAVDWLVGVREADIGL